MKIQKTYGISAKNVSEENLVFKYINSVESFGSTSYIIPKRKMGYGVNFIGTITSTKIAEYLQLGDEPLTNFDELLKGVMSPGTLKNIIQSGETAAKIMRGIL